MTARPTAARRGYDHRHQQLRAHWAPQVATGTVTCWRCHQPIHPRDAWDLGHHDDGTHAGPEHQHCNRSAAGKRSAALHRTRQRPQPPHPGMK